MCSRCPFFWNHSLKKKHNSWRLFIFPLFFYFSDRWASKVVEQPVSSVVVVDGRLCIGDVRLPLNANTNNRVERGGSGTPVRVYFCAAHIYTWFPNKKARRNGCDVRESTATVCSSQSAAVFRDARLILKIFPAYHRLLYSFLFGNRIICSGPLIISPSRV